MSSETRGANLFAKLMQDCVIGHYYLAYHNTYVMCINFGCMSDGNYSEKLNDNSFTETLALSICYQCTSHGEFHEMVREYRP